MHYRCARVPGETYFFTVNLANRSSRLLTDKIDDLREAIRKVHRAHPFQIVGWGEVRTPTFRNNGDDVGVPSSPQPTIGDLMKRRTPCIIGARGYPVRPISSR